MRGVAGVELHTFSIAARSPADGSFGVAVSTARPVVGSLVPFVSLKGSIATQARVNTDLGRYGLALLEAGVGIDAALDTLLAQDEDRTRRQVHGVDAAAAFTFTGDDCVPWAGHRAGDHCTVAGNMLVGPEVVEAMAETFEATASDEVDLSERLLQALESGQQAGGDKRGRQSAALLIVSPDPRMYHNLRVDDHADPVAELRRIHTIVVEQSRTIEAEYGREGLRLFSKIKY
jgi:uncharacterized Ntn-hydrolase superfamily protein